MWSLSNPEYVFMQYNIYKSKKKWRNRITVIYTTGIWTETVTFFETSYVVYGEDVEELFRPPIFMSGYMIVLYK